LGLGAAKSKTFGHGKTQKLPIFLVEKENDV
jgi:hypothetical protein